MNTHKDKDQPKSAKPIIHKINDAVALKISLAVSSVWAFYVFVLFGLFPLFWPQQESNILYWSNFLQLIFLPIITVGAVILGRDSEKRQAEDHKHITSSFKTLHTSVEEVQKLLTEIKANHIISEKILETINKKFPDKGL